MTKPTKPITLNAHNFEAEVLQAKVPVLVDFWATWCGPCNALTPVIEALAAEVGESAKVGKLNADEHPDLLARYNVRALPTLLVFRDGEVVDQLIGAHPKGVLKERLQRHAVA